MAGGTFGGGNGTVDSPYLVEDAADLSVVRNLTDAHYKQVANIDLISIVNFAPIPGFSGSYDGGGYKIDRLKISPGITTLGLFGITTLSSIIKNVTLTNCDVLGSNFTGSLIAQSYGLVENCKASGNVSRGNRSARTPIGGLIGSVEAGEVKRCSFVGNVKVENSTIGELWMGGFVGYVNSASIVEDCYSQGEVSSSVTASSFCGGFAGGIYGTVNRCYSSSNTNAELCAGGFVGLAGAGAISDCFSKGNARSIGSSSSSIAGGFVGVFESSGNIVRCYCTGNVYARASGGGFAGRSNNSSKPLSDSYTLSPIVERGSGSTSILFSRFVGNLAGTLYGTGRYALSTMEFRG